MCCPCKAQTETDEWKKKEEKGHNRLYLNLCCDPRMVKKNLERGEKWREEGGRTGNTPSKRLLFAFAVALKPLSNRLLQLHRRRTLILGWKILLICLKSHSAVLYTVYWCLIWHYIIKQWQSWTSMIFVSTWWNSHLLD